MVRWIALVVLAASGCAAAPPELFIDEHGYIHSSPPAQYDRMYEGDLTVLVVPANKVAQACMELSKAHGGRMQTDDAVGCAIVRDAYCAVVIPETPAVIVYNGEVYPVTPEAVLHHELGHCNGWRHR